MRYYLNDIFKKDRHACAQVMWVWNKQTYDLHAI